MLKTNDPIDTYVVQNIADIREAIILLYVAIELMRENNVAARYQVAIVQEILADLK
jgi:hypothetical protein